jgi:hypothetical protein
MTELSNTVTVLIARMESHPEDFELHGKHRAKFAGTAESLYGLCGMDKERADAFWFLNDADKQALIDAWKQFHCKQHEKEVLNAIFDESYYERQQEQEREMVRMKQQMYQAQANQAAMSSRIHPLQNAIQGGNYNGGLLGQAGSAIQGIFK